MPLARSRRQVVSNEKYKPSRRRRAPRHRVSLQRHRLPRECVVYIQPCRYDAWLWLPPQDPAAKPPPNRRPLWLPLHCAAARQEASLRFVPRQPNPQKKEQHQENYHSSLLASFSPYCSLIKGTKTVQVMLARRVPVGTGGLGLLEGPPARLRPLSRLG